ncbi:MAG: hypothetical protein HY748_04645 [Elusimicrobia bacterium]|nr:hypothetical protein [Elusimicrobiota bacterium]
MGKLLRKTVSLVLALSVLLYGFPVVAVAEAARGVQPVKGSAKDDVFKRALDAVGSEFSEGVTRDKASKETALAYLKSKGVYKDEGDPVYSYLVNGGKLSPMGEVLFSYLKSLPNPAEEVEAIQEQIKMLRESGPSTEKKQAVMDRVVTDFNQKFGQLADQDGSVEDLFRYGALREAIMTGAAVADAPKRSFTQVETSDGWELWDKEGLAYKLNKNQVTTYNRDLQKKQRVMNQSRPPQSPFIPETGRYNYEMLQYSYFRLLNQHKELDKAYHIDRMIGMAELLGKQYKDDMWFTDLTLEEDLERWAKKKTFKHAGSEHSVYDIVEAKMKGRVVYLGKAKEGLSRFEYEIGRMKGLETVNEPRVQTLQMHENYIVRFLSLSYLESQKYHVKAQLERLDPKSPDAALFDKALLESPLDDATKQLYQREREKLHRRVEALKKRLLQIQDVLLASDYAGNLDIVTAALNAGQKDIAEISLDYSLFADLPAMMLMSKSQLGEVKLENLGAWAVKAYWKLGIHGSHASAMDKINGALPQYIQAAQLVARGDYWGARRLIAGIHPDAAYVRMESGMGGGAGKVTENLRVAASLGETRRMLMQVAGTNQWVNAAGNYLTYAVALALAAPVMSGAMSGVSRVAGWLNTPFARSPYMGLPLKMVEETALHASLRLNSLSPAAQNIPNASQNALLNGLWRYGAYSGVRFVNAAARQMAFTLTAGTISSAFTVGGHLWDEYVPEFDLFVIANDKDHSPFRSGVGGALEAAGVGFKGGVVWANESWHPLLGYIGVPSSAYEGTVLAWPAEVIGSHGFFGSVGNFAQKVGIPISEKLSLQALAETGKAGLVGSFALGMADNIAKYALFSNAVGKVAEMRSWAMSSGEPDLERRIKTAQRAKNWWLESAVWMALPVYPAKYQLLAAEGQRAKQGQAEYDREGRRHEYANASEGQELPLLGKPKMPVVQQIFDLRWLGESKEGGTWKVTKEIKRSGMAAELVEALGGKGAKASDINPLELFKVTRMDDGKTVGKLFMNDEVRLLAGERFIESLAGRKGLVELVLNAKPGADVPGFGHVTPSLKREVALAVKLKPVKGVAFSPEATALAEALMKPYFEADSVPKPAGKAFIEAVRANSNVQSPALEKAVEDMWLATAEWKANRGKEGHPMFKKGYMDLVSELKSKVERAPNLTVAEKLSMTRLYDYFDAIEARFNSFNKVGVVDGLAKENLAALKEQFKGNPKVTELTAKFEANLANWRSQAQDPNARAVTGKGSAYRNAVGDCMTELHGRKANLSPADYDAVKAALKEMEAAPWAVRDSKGSPLWSWRPEQFEAMMTSLGLITLMGRGGTPIQEFLLLKTGGGKTMMVFEGLLPIAEADAAFHKMTVTFLTVQSNLEAQARLEFNAYKKVASKLEFMTYEEFKSKIAEKKLVGKDIVKKHWIFGDEGDGAALQPMLTIGETTAQIAKSASAYKLIESISKSLEARVGKGSIEIAEGVKAEVKRVQAVAEGVDARTPEGAALRSTMAKLLKAADRLGLARSPEQFALAKAEIEGILKAQSGIAESAGPLKARAELLAKLTANADRMLKLADTIEKARKPEVVARSAEQLQSLLKKQQALIDQADLGGSVRGTSLKSAAESLRARLFNAVQAGDSPMIAKKAEWAKAVRESSQAQRQALNDQPAAGPDQLSAIRELKSKVMDRLNSRPEMLKEARMDLVQEVQKSIRQQENLLGLVRRDPASALMDLWGAVSKEKSAAQSRVDIVSKELAKVERDMEAFSKRGKTAEALKAKAEALKIEVAMLKERIKVYEGFSSGSPDLAQSRQASLELRQSALRREAVLNQELAKTQRKVVEARVRGESTEVLESRIKTIEGEIAVAKADLVKAGSGTPPTRSDLAHARSLLSQDSREIVRIIEEGKPGWESAAMERLAVREKLVRGFASSDNPIYEIYRGMRRDMYTVASDIERMSPDAAVGDAAVLRINRALDGRSLLGLGATYMKNLVTGGSMRVEDIGLTRVKGVELLKAVMSDSVMPHGQKMDLFWNIVPSILWPRGPTGRGGSWVRNELINLARGHFDNPATVRLDNRAKRINIIHNGQWFDSMDTPTRRFWEIEYGTDLTLPYKHKTVSTIKDIIDNKKARFVLMSGTAGTELRRIMESRGTRFGGSPSKAPENVGLDLKSQQGEKFVRIRETLETAAGTSKDYVVVKPQSGKYPEAVKAWLKTAGVGDESQAVVRISQAPTKDGVRAYLTRIRQDQPGSTSLTVLSLSDTRALREVRKYLIKQGLAKPNEIAQVFSDTEWLRENRPQADVLKQMNLDGLNTGEVKILLLDTRVGGRGLDLNFKGDRENPDPKAFKGYTNYEMLVIDPHDMSAVHLLQAQGRIDVARVLFKALRNFTLVMDVGSLKNSPIFAEMVQKDPVFAELRADPEAQAYAKKQGLALDWPTIHEYLRRPETVKLRPELVARYNDAVRKALDAKQLDVELEQLRSSSVGEKSTRFDPKYRGLEYGGSGP